jgi:mutual gliding-motility protein MglA
MSVVNYAAKQVNFKIVYYGPGVAGKTTNLQSIHAQLAEESRGEMMMLNTGDDRTLFFDFLPVSAFSVAGFTMRFQLYTVPGQPHHNMTRKLVLRGVDGVVFVADSQWDRAHEAVASFRNLEENLREHQHDLERLPYVLQYNKRDLPHVAPVPYLDSILNRRARRVPAFEAIATTGEGVFETLNMIARMVLAVEFGAEAEGNGA